jgi:hypothetical protein
LPSTNSKINNSLTANWKHTLKDLQVNILANRDSFLSLLNSLLIKWTYPNPE